VTHLRILLLALSGALVTASAPLVLHGTFRDAPPPAHTGGFGEPTCHACHVGSDLNDARGALDITVPDYYTPGASYGIRVRLKHPEMMAGGFQLSIRDASGAQAGRFVMDTASTGVTTLNGIAYVHHRRVSASTNTDSIVWTFDWIAPDRAGSVTIHSAANAANDDASPLGDFVYAESAVVNGRAHGTPVSVPGTIKRPH